MTAESLEESANVHKFGRFTYGKCSLALIVHLKLNDDTLVEVECSTLNTGCSVALGDCAKVAHHLSNFLRGNDRTILALNKEQTSRHFSNVVGLVEDRT